MRTNANTNGDLDPNDRRRIDEFLSLFNDVHEVLRRLIRKPRAGFGDAAIRYSGTVVGWGEQAAFLNQVRELRNTLVHEQRNPVGYLAVPTQGVIQRLEEIRSELVEPEAALVTFGKPVTCFEAGNELGIILETIASEAFSQFPIYNGASFIGLLTENGVTRWLATRAVEAGPTIDLRGTTAEDVIQGQELVENCRFVGQSMPLREVRYLFATLEHLEAVLVTEKGKVSRNLLGIGTRWDLLQHRPAETKAPGG